MIKVKQYQVPIHPRNLSQIVHPHQGYLCAFPGRGFSWDEFINFYETMMVSTYEKTRGRYLHAEEIAALAYYMLQDEKRGWIEWSEPDEKRKDTGMGQLLQSLHFYDQVSHETFLQSFDTLLNTRDFLGKGANHIYRWDLTRRIWLERGL